MSEILKVFNQNYQLIGKATRQQVHAEGLWHETFHCWLFRYTNQQVEVLLQHRSSTKADFPNLLDISAAGHLLADEAVVDGVREIQEELGLVVRLADLVPLGIFPMAYQIDNFFDREFTNIFALEIELEPSEFDLQEAEVQGMYYCNLLALEKLLHNQIDSIDVSGFKRGKKGNREATLSLTKTDICAQSLPYYDFLFEQMKKMVDL